MMHAHHWPLWILLSAPHLVNLSYEERLRQLSCSAWRRFQGDLTVSFQYLKGAYRQEGDGVPLFKEEQ